MPLRIEPVRDRKLHRLLKAAPEQRLPRGHILYGRGEEADGVFVVRRGHVRLVLDGRGDSRTVAVAGPWELFAEEAMVPGSLRPYTAIAGERCMVSTLDGAEVRSVLRTSQHTLTTYLEVKERELRLLRDANGGSRPTTRERLAAVLLDLADRLGAEEEGIHVPHWFTHRELGDLAGAHRSTVTTTLNDWLYEGILEEAPRGFRLARPEALRREAGLQPADPPPARSWRRGKRRAPGRASN